MTSAWPRSRLKRGVDLVASLALLVLTAPVAGVVAVLVRWRLGSPVLFRQRRAGLDGAVFTLYKFRSMTAEHDDRGVEVTEADRITRLGRALRTTSLDELPQLWNVATGEMSLVGPRPLLPEYVDRYSPEQRRRLLVRPGITGLAQVNGRNDLTWEHKFGWDLVYVDRASVMTDLRILVRTLWRLVRPLGVTTAGHATSPVFEGAEAR